MAMIIWYYLSIKDKVDFITVMDLMVRMAIKVP